MNAQDETRQDETRTDRLPDDDAVASRARGIFRSACENTDSFHALRLGLARRKALQATHSPALWAPLGGAAVACCALVVGMLVMHPDNRVATLPVTTAATPVGAGPASVIEEIPEVSSNQMDMVQDLEFYRWLATQPSVAAASGHGGH